IATLLTEGKSRDRPPRSARRPASRGKERDRARDSGGDYDTHCKKATRFGLRNSWKGPPQQIRCRYGPPYEGFDPTVVPPCPRFTRRRGELRSSGGARASVDGRFTEIG